MSSRTRKIIRMTNNCKVFLNYYCLIKDAPQKDIYVPQTNVLSINEWATNSSSTIIKDWLNDCDFQNIPVLEPIQVTNAEIDLNNDENKTFANLGVSKVNEGDEMSHLLNKEIIPQLVISNIVLKLPSTESKKNQYREDSDSDSIVPESICDDINDKCFNIFDEDSRESTTEEEISGSQSTLVVKEDIEPISEQIKKKKGSVKFIRCQYCHEDIISKNFLRHLQRHHSTENEVIKILNYPKNSKGRREALLLLRNSTNFDLFINGTVFDMMKGDKIAFQAKKDLLIAHFGESYLKKHKRECMTYVCSNRMRELARILIRYKELVKNDKVTFKELLHPINFDTVIQAVRDVAGYDPFKKTFKTPSLAMHLKLACDELIHLVMKETKGFKCSSQSEATIWIKNIKNFKKLIESRWNIELSSLAAKDLDEKKVEETITFTIRSKVQWGKGDVAIRNLAKKLNLKNPQDFTSNKLRKHIATVMQLLNLSADEMKQFSSFMGHTPKTIKTFTNGGISTSELEKPNHKSCIALPPAKTIRQVNEPLDQIENETISPNNSINKQQEKGQINKNRRKENKEEFEESKENKSNKKQKIKKRLV
ncbi:hypothetical protein FQR65_LT17836 [Abscondita terminalis]|nr:hypothetical protein FQR65_LT17836 [Abscondita terminalis]